MLCPSCASELTAEQVELGECPHCGSAVGVPPGLVEEPFGAPGEPPASGNQQWDGFQGASLEWEPAVDGEEATFEEPFQPTPAAGELPPSEPPVSFDSKTVAMSIPGDADESTPGEGYSLAWSGDTPSVESKPPRKMRPEAVESGEDPSVFRGSRARSRDMSHTPPTSDELQTLAREWGDLEGSVSQATVKPSREGGSAEGPTKPRSIHDTVESLPRRRVRASGEKLEHPEYELLQMLGEGGMGVVWDARQTSIDRSVAVKMIKGPLAEKLTQRRKFLAEAVVTGDLDHPNIVPIYDVGTDIQGKLFYAMKRVDGTPWLEVFREKSQHENLQILLRVADAVAFAHSRGIIHRDIKPENVMLGGFGEVLLMDWGLALPTREYRKAQSLEFTTGMGGTPAYMAPEMAKGPVDRITVASDIYLLGAILYDIITGMAPHAATSVRDCLIAAMRNRIVPTDQEGELVDIAMKAMATEPADRYGSVLEFQAVIRDYLSHEESLSLAARAHADLEAAQQTDEYSDYARAVFGFEEAYELWNGNHDAYRGIATAKLAYARSAYVKGDYDLGLSLLDPERADHQVLRQQLASARDESRARQRRLTAAKRMAVTAASVAFLAIAAALLTVTQARRELAKTNEQLASSNKQLELSVAAEKAAVTQEKAQRQIAVDAKIAADMARDDEKLQREKAEKAQMEAETQRMAADTARVNEEEQRKLAEQAAEEAKQAEAAARAAQAREMVARVQAEEARNKEEYKAYVAGIGAAAARIDEGSIEAATSILDGLSKSRAAVMQDGTGAIPLNWEWGRLKHLCQLYSEDLPGTAPIDALAVSRDGARLAAGSQDGVVRIYEMASGDLLAELRHKGSYIHSVAWSPDGNWLATGSSERNAFVQLWNVAEKTSQTLSGHTLPATRVRFSDDGRWLLSCSFDKTAQLWDLSNTAQPRLATTLVGHDWWVRDGALAPDFDPYSENIEQHWIVTAGQDGQAILWQRKSGDALINIGGPPAALKYEKDRVFLGHDGPVYAVDFAKSADGFWIATGGYDNRVLLWHPEGAQEFTKKFVFDPGQSKYRELQGHTNAVQSVSFSEDGKLLVSAGQDNAVWVWSLDGTRERFRLKGHSSEVRSAIVTPDGQHVVSAGLDKQILIWSAKGEQELHILRDRQLTRHEDAVLSARFSHDGSQVLTASSDKAARLWDAETTADPTSTLQQGHQYLVSGAVLFPDGLTLATAAADDTTRVWDIRSGSQLRVLRRTGRNGVVALSHDAAWLVTGGRQATGPTGSLTDERQYAVQVWPVAAIRSTAEVQPEPAPLIAHAGDVTAAACSPVANLAATGDLNGVVVLWDLDTREKKWEPLRQHNRRINALQFTPDGSRIIVSSADNTLSRIDVSTGKEYGSRLSATGAVRAFAVSSDGRRVFVAEESKSANEAAPPTSTLVVYDLASGQEVRRLGPYDIGIASVMVDPGDQSVLVAGRDSTVYRVSANDAAPPAPLLSVDRRYGDLAAAVLSSDGELLVTMNGADVQLYEAKTGARKLALRPQDALADAEFSPDGKLIITASWDGTVQFWDATQQPPITVGTLSAHDSFVNSAVFSPDGKWVLTCSEDSTARLFDVQTRVEIHRFTDHTGPVNQAIFSPDGSMVLTVSDDKTARLWDPNTGLPIGEAFQNRHSQPILCAAFSADGKSIATGGEDSQVVLWDVESRSQRAVLRGHTAAITAVAFSPDDARVFTASRDRTAKVWDVSPAGLQFAETVAPDERDWNVGAPKAYDLLTLTGHAREVTSLAVSADGRKVLTGSRDRTAIIWNTADWTQAAVPAEPPLTVSAGQP